ncbi:DEAD/DEAH box helicase family protein [Escherichia coli]
MQRISGNRKSALINRVPEDFFDFIIVDEAHHAQAQSWRDALNISLKQKFYMSQEPLIVVMLKKSREK